METGCICTEIRGLFVVFFLQFPHFIIITIFEISIQIIQISTRFSSDMLEKWRKSAEETASGRKR